MTIELTRELLERYLRAIGRNDLATALPRDIRAALRDLEHYSFEGMADIRFRLGLCAAAESISARIAKLRVHQQAGAACYCDDAIRIDLAAMKNDLLHAAGIDPAAWEAAK